MSPQPEPVNSVSRALTQKPLTCVEKLNRIQLFFLSFLSLLLLSAEDSVSCENPGVPDNSYQILSKRLYLPGESLTFVCYQGYELIGEVAIKCILGNPSFWSGPLPLCRGETFAKCFSLFYLRVCALVPFSCYLWIWSCPNIFKDSLPHARLYKWSCPYLHAC